MCGLGYVGMSISSCVTTETFWYLDIGPWLANNVWILLERELFWGINSISFRLWGLRMLGKIRKDREKCDILVLIPNSALIIFENMDTHP